VQDDRYMAELGQAILESAISAIFITDEIGAIVEFNPSAERVFGFKRSEALGRNAVELLSPPSLLERHYELLRHYASAEIAHGGERQETIVRRADGSEIPMELTVIRANQGGKAILIVAGRDISEQKRSAERRQAAQAATQIIAETPALTAAIPRLLESICENLNWDLGAFWRGDKDLNIVWCQEVYCAPEANMLRFAATTRGLAFPPGVGLPGRVWESGKADWSTDVVRDTNFPRSPVAAHDDVHAGFAVPIYRDKQVWGVMEFFSREVRERDEGVLNLVTTVCRQLNQFAQREEAIETVRQMEERLRLVTHELRTPLTSIKGFTQLALRWLEGKNGDVRVKDSLVEIAAASETLERFAEEFLTVSHIEMGLRKPRWQRLAVAPFVRRAVAEFAGGDAPVLTGRLTHASIQADPQLIRQVIWNLLDNAVRHSPKEEKVRVQARVRGGEVIISVVDHGSGVPEKEVPALFEKFARGRRRSSTSLGLGLYIAKVMIEAHGGRLWYEPTTPHGATFSFSLPISPALGARGLIGG